MDVLLPILIAFISMFVPGALLALALLKGTKLHAVETLTIGFIFGMIAPATLTWIDSYFMDSIHFFAFSLELFEINAVIIAVIGAILCYQQGVFKRFFGKKSSSDVKTERIEYRHELSDVRSELRGFEKARDLIERHERVESELRGKHENELRLITGFTDEERAKVHRLHESEELELKNTHVNEERSLLSRLKGGSVAKARGGPSIWVWAILLALILVTFSTRIFNISVSPTFFQFDSYFDMLNTQRIITLGYQPLYSPSAWPASVNGTITRVQPLIPYLEAYWYSLANYFNPTSGFDTNMMSFVSSIYPALAAALLVFVIFMLLYTEYDEYIGLIGATLAASVPILFTTFIAGQQLLQAWGIFSLFFFFAAYMLAVKDPKNMRYAILAGVAFASTFLGAHYYTVDAGILALYIIAQGIISTLRGEVSKDFYRMNIIVLAIIAIFLAIYEPYGAVYGGGLPTVLGIPITIALPALALIFVAIIDLLPKYMHDRHLLFKKIDFKARAGWLVLILLIIGLAIAFTPLGSPIQAYVNLSAKFTTPSTPLFMTVQEYAPTGLLYNFGAAGMGIIAASAFGAPLMVYIVITITALLLLISVFYRKSNTGLFYLLIGALAIAAFSEVAYIPHFSAAYVMFFGIIIGEVGVLAGNNFNIKFTEMDTKQLLKKAYSNNKDLMFAVFSVALFFLSPIIAMAFLLAIIFMHKADKRSYMWALFVLFAIIMIAGIAAGSAINGEANSLIEAFSAIATQASNPAQACTVFSNSNNEIGLNLFCNTIPQYWQNAMAFIHVHIGPNGPRVLSWWDYGDWINWFGQTPAVIRGDNAVPKEDFATAANFVLGTNESYSPAALANFMNTNQTGYVLFDQDLVGKWGALDFLACVNVNETSRAFAIAQGAQQNPQQPFVLGTSRCEVDHDPQFVLVPLPALAPSIQQPSLGDYCSISNNATQYALSYLVVGSNLANKSVCVSLASTTSVAQIYYENGTKLNAVVPLQSQQPLGAIRLASNGPTYLEYLVIYLPNGPNNTITNAPTGFYNSNFYKGFFLGSMPGFTQVYPSNATGINFVNGTYPVRIFKLNNFTGQLPSHSPKPPYVTNNYTIP